MINTEGKTLSQVCKEIGEALVKQGSRCMTGTDSGSCAYGDGQGNHCAIGHLLPEDNWGLMGFEGGLVSLMGNENLGPNGEFIREHSDVLTSIQSVHDRSGIRGIQRAVGTLPVDLRPLFDAWVSLRTAQNEVT